MSLLQNLIAWRDAKAAQSGQPPYYILSTTTVKLLASARPTNREEFLAIKGLGDAKWDRFGVEILSLIHEPVVATPKPQRKKKGEIVQGDFLWDALPAEEGSGPSASIDRVDTSPSQTLADSEIDIPLSVDEYLTGINGMLVGSRPGFRAK